MAQPEFYSGKLLYPAIGVLIALSALFGLAILPRFSPSGGHWTGKPAPDFVLPVVANGEPGSRMKLSDATGHPVVVDFWATWCGPCQIEAPILDRVARRYRARGLVVMGVAVDDPAEAVAAFAQKKGISYPLLLDEDKVASGLYGVDSLPSLVIVDKQGRIVSFLMGVVDEGALDEIIAAEL